MPNQKRQRKREGRQLRIEAERRAQQAARRRNQAIRGVGAVIALLAIVFVISKVQGNDDKKEDVKTSASTTTSGPSTTLAEGAPPRAEPVPAGKTVTGETPCPKDDGSSEHTDSFAQAPKMCIDPAKKYTAVFDTSEGVIEVALDTKTTPGTVNNFVVLSRYHYYDGSAIHRTDPSIDIIQGGSPKAQSASDPGPGYNIKDEGAPPRHYTEGDLVMARGAGPDSGSAQYFFVAGPKAANLDSQGTYVTFGKVSKGLDIVKKILAMHQEDPTSQLGGAPKKVVLVKKLTIKEA